VTALAELRASEPAPRYSYLGPGDDRLVNLSDPADLAPPLASLIHDPLRALVQSSGFTCLGAKAAFERGSYRLGLFGELGGVEATEGLARGLRRFVEERGRWRDGFSSYLAAFAGPTAMDEVDFERCLWRQLQHLHELDGAGWDPSVASDPAEPEFSFSFEGTAFFVVGLHPASSRWTRRFAWPVLVFNSHDQFERLRAEGSMARMQAVIRARDVDLQQSINPNLSDFGEMPEARQYSGRRVERDWTCPFRL
jgi:FPC/CPF motif-containing protein YcgG